jgi:hypothetical protein
MITPRRTRFFVVRTAYVAILLILMCTAWLVLAGAQRVRDLGDLARFGMILFQILAPLQLVVASFSAALLAASAVAQEKDRRTLILLLMTHLTNSELVLGRLMASLLNVLVLLTAALPLFALTTLLGGIAPGPDRAGLRRDAGQRVGLREPRLDGRPVAREDVPVAGPDRAGDGALAGGGPDRRQRLAGRQLGGYCDRDLGRRAEPLAGDPRSRPGPTPNPTRRWAGWPRRPISSCWSPPAWPWRSMGSPWPWCGSGTRRGKSSRSAVRTRPGTGRASGAPSTMRCVRKCALRRPNLNFRFPGRRWIRSPSPSGRGKG